MGFNLLPILLMRKDNSDIVFDEEILKNVSGGMVAGFCTGFALKKVGKITAIGLGMTIIGGNILKANGYIETKAFEPKVIADTIEKYGDELGNKDGKFDSTDIKIMYDKFKAATGLNAENMGGAGTRFILGLRFG